MLEELDVLVLFNTFGTFFDLKKSNKKEPKFHFDAEVKKMKTGKGGLAAGPELDIFVFLESLFNSLFSSLANLVHLVHLAKWPTSQISRILLQARI